MTGAPPTTGGRLVYAVGDIHGHLDALRPLIGMLRDERAFSRPAERPLLVFLGDYVDRGPDSRGVIEAILALEAAGDFEVVALKGNHEDALLRFLSDADFGAGWIGNWGETTLRSYGVALPAPGQEAAESARVQAELRAAMPEAHRAFLDRLAMSLSVGDYLFVHAGVRPGVALAAQDDQDLMWIRYDFLESDADFGKVVVHGHTPADRPELRRNRIGIDTGVYYSGVLTAVRLEGTDQRIIQAQAER
ncbi:MAG: metallophosphoesterase family protein [Phenylobacterium sp.]